MNFQTYEVAVNNPLINYDGAKIGAISDHDGRYTLYVHLKNGLGLSSVEKLTLLEATTAAFQFADELGYSDDMVYIDLPSHVLDQASILSRKLRKKLQARGLYWKRR